jgi:predicted glycoside hydrolase/deacetylase ChbG (UPF0249 family)
MSSLRHGVLIVNADDWGRDTRNTDRTLDCVVRGTVTAVSAMVFMEDSERAAEIACERGISAGLHLNFTTAFSGSQASHQLRAHLERVSRYLGKRRMAQAIFHPGLSNSFDYLVAVQREEFCRLYGSEPKRLDGHHHMHLSANVLFGGLLPAGTTIRRNFSFLPGEKSLANRLYRRALDSFLARRHELTDYFFSLPPLAPPSRLQRIFSLAKEFRVEVETHPVSADEYSFLTGEEIFKLIANVSTAAK